MLKERAEAAVGERNDPDPRSSVDLRYEWAVFTYILRHHDDDRSFPKPSPSPHGGGFTICFCVS